MGVACFGRRTNGLAASRPEQSAGLACSIEWRYSPKLLTLRMRHNVSFRKCEAQEDRAGALLRVALALLIEAGNRADARGGGSERSVESNSPGPLTSWFI
jgi:hypothetical protein